MALTFDDDVDDVDDDINVDGNNINLNVYDTDKFCNKKKLVTKITASDFEKKLDKSFWVGCNVVVDSNNNDNSDGNDDNLWQQRVMTKGVSISPTSELRPKSVFE